MGCVQSKFDTDLIKFCRERKDLVKASRDSWHSISRAHMAYVQSLQNVENGIRKFTMEVVVIRFKSPFDMVSVNKTVEDDLRLNDSSSESHEGDGYLDPTHSEIENTSDVFSEEESIIVYEQPQTPPSNTTSFIDQPHHKNPCNLSNDGPDNSYFPQTRNMEFYRSSGVDFPNGNQASFDDLMHNMPNTSNFNDQEGSFSLPGDATWRNATLFNSFEEFFSNLNFQGTYESNFGDINEVRETGGISNLEDELHDPPLDVFSTKEESEVDLTEDSNNSLSGEATNGGHDFFPNETEVQEDSEIRYSSPRVDESEETETSTPIYCSTNLHDVLVRIKEVFDTILTNGKDVSEMLKPFEPHVTLIKGSTSKGTTIVRRVLLRKQNYRKLEYAYNGECGKEPDANSCNLSWTLENLYTWEKKLYDELKVEEKLRKIIERKREKLKNLDNNGAESVKIDAIHSLLKGVTSKMDVSVSKIERISKATHEIRRDELQPQLCAYIYGLHKLSKLSFESQQKQVQAIGNSLAKVDTVTCKISSSSQIITKKLEKEVIRLQTTFSCWVKSHKEFVVLLKKWFLKFEDQSEVSDSNPLNVSKLCEEWLKALEKISDLDLLVALQSFTLILQQLEGNLQEERFHRIRLQHFANYHEQKLKRLCKENEVDYEKCKSLFIEAELIGGISGYASLDALYTRLRPIREKVREASTKHEEAMNRVNDTARGIFQNSILPVLAALERFNFEIFTTYEQVRILNERSAQ